MSDAFADVAKMKKIKEDIKAHEGQLVELTLENGRKREKNKIGRLTEAYPSLLSLNTMKTLMFQVRLIIHTLNHTLIQTF